MLNIRNALEIAGWMTPAELTWLALQAQSHTRILELGSWCGRSTRALAEHTSGYVQVVDVWAWDAERLGSFVQFEHEAQQNPDWIHNQFVANMAGLDNIRECRATSLEGAKQLAGQKFDMIFIDADHEYESVRADIEAWRPLLVEGGLLCGHDYASDFPGVIKAVHELIERPRVAIDTIWMAA